MSSSSRSAKKHGEIRQDGFRRLCGEKVLRALARASVGSAKQSKSTGIASAPRVVLSTGQRCSPCGTALLGLLPRYDIITSAMFTKFNFCKKGRYDSHGWITSNYSRYRFYFNRTLFKFSLSSGKFLASLTWWAVIVFGFLTTLIELNVAVGIINTLLTGLVAMLALAGGLAFGLGGRDSASRFIDRLKEDFSHKS